MFLVKKGIEVMAIKEGEWIGKFFDKKKINDDVIYDKGEVEIDPIGSLACHKGFNTIGGKFAKKGFYGFKLPKNKRGYVMILVHSNEVEYVG